MASKTKESVDYRIKLAEVEKMFDLEAFIKAEPDCFDGLCKDYPLKEDKLYLIKVKGGNK